MFSLADIRGSDINGRIVIQESLFTELSAGSLGQARKQFTFAVSLPILLFGLVIMTTLPVRSGRLSSFHLGFLSFSGLTRGRPEESRLDEDSGAKGNMGEERVGNGGRADSH